MTTTTADLVKAFNSGLRGLAQQPATSAVMSSFQSLHQAAMKPGALDTATKELLAIAIAIATHCEGCIAWHVTSAVRSGATREQVLETIGVAVMMGGGPSTYYGSKAAEALDSLTDN